MNKLPIIAKCMMGNKVGCYGGDYRKIGGMVMRRYNFVGLYKQNI